MKRLSFLFCTLILAISVNAQAQPDMADLMRSNGKIYVVLAVCLLILFGLFLYVFLLDRKIRKIEKDNK